MDNLGGIAILVIIWIVGAVFDKKRKEERRRAAKKRLPPPTPIDVESVSIPSGPDPSQVEGGALEKILRQIDPELADQALGKRPLPVEAAPPPSVPTPAPVSTPRTRRPAASDRSAETRAAIARRLDVARDRLQGRTAGDHAVFHDAIREPAKVTKVAPRYSVADMRRAIVWREILGPPRAETIDDL